ncbi:MAG: glycoside hydrolase family 127 protein [Planctomycetota bacterium]|nr:glycoside hydrolase family 127 protein [Planctomycetota bacterium]
MHTPSRFTRLAAAALMFTPCAAQETTASAPAPEAVAPAQPARVLPVPAVFSLPTGVTVLLDAPAPFTNPFKTACDAHAQYLLRLDPARLLARFRIDAGLETKVEGYDGWERDTIGGHSLGHYLSACVKMFSGTHDRRFLERVEFIVDELALCQARNGENGFPGYVSAIPGGKKALAEVAAGNIRSKGFDLNGIWVPWYTMHKLMAGLRDASIVCGNQKAREVCRGLGDYSYSIVRSLTDEQLDQMLRCEHGGMNEVATDLWLVTANPDYLDLARRFNDRRVLTPLAEGKDILSGLHANTQIPKIIGAARQYELTGDAALGRAARFFFETVTRHHTYATGGNSMNEYLGPPDVLGARLEGNTTETCNTYNMLKLARHLHDWSGDAAIMDYYERALYNHILASKDPAGDGVCYFTPLRAGSTKPFQRPFDDFTCCVGTGMENHASYAEAIYSGTAPAASSGQSPALLVNLFISSRLDWITHDLRLIQETGFPDQESTLLRLECRRPVKLALKIRMPGWLAAAPSIEVNGTRIEVDTTKGTYCTIDREWKNGDQVRISLPMQVTAEATPDDPDRVAFLYGPIVLAGVMEQTETDIRRTPHLVCDAAELTSRITRTDAGRLAFRTNHAAKPADLPLIPLYRIGSERYLVYWKRLSESQWALRQGDIERAEAEQRARIARTVDFFQPGEMQPERDHGFDGVFTNAGEHMGRRWRDAGPRGWVAFNLKVPKEGPAALVCTYWGSDSGGREFDISIDDVVIATQVLDHSKPNEFFDVEYPIPAAVLTGKNQVRVKLASKPDRMTGGLFGCGILRAPSPAP